ncbi:MAG TPA: FG-GAP-like repeat-containing protein [Pseudoxanthomonas sp.]|nr:FG-GAP-like repeat-containing protein [Pseudoxanthomonas sp.]
MKFRLGACAAVILLAACSGEKSADGVAQLPGKSSSDAAMAAAAVKTGRSVLASIANAPDRGALMSYQNKGKPSKREGAFTYYPVAMSEDHALRGVVSGHMTVPMPDGTQVKLNYERHDETIDGNWTWVGRVEGGDPNQEAIITFGEKAVFASIPQGAGRPPVSIQTNNGQLYAVQVDPSQLKSGNAGQHSDTAIPSPSAIVEAAAAQITASAAVAQSAQMVAANAPPTSLNTVDLAIGYTANFRTTNGGSASAAITRLAQLISIGNESLRNSKVNGYIRLVHALEVGYTETNTNQTALQELTGSNGVDPVTVPAALAPLRAARETYGADLVLLVRQFQQPEQAGCGIAWLIGADETDIVPANHSRWGYGVVSDGNDANYYCPPESFIHEIGHLMGSAHNQANADGPGRYPYSYGYKADAANGNFFTIMAYGDENQTPYRFFSSPTLTCGSRPCGTATADNARSLNNTFPVITQFRASVVPFNRGLGNDFNGDGRSDVFWRNSQTNGNSLWWSASPTGSYSSNTAANWSVVGSGDFNGDGKSDLLWRSTTGSNSIWWGGAVTGATNSYTALPWQVAGVGDFNGDGRADIFWRNPTNGTNSIWWGGAVTGATNSNTATVWSVVGIGDFNGDGRSDILWRNPTSLNNSIWFSGVAAGARSSSVAANWSVAGVGDFDGDGASDILWRNTTGGNSIWWKGVATGGRSSSQAIAWTVETTGDFDGDGNWDIFWRNRGTGENQIWLSGLPTTVQAVPAVGGTAWAIQP